MIAPNELRIGNLILKDGKVFSYAGVDAGVMYDGYIGASRHGGVVDFDLPEYFYGLPLSPEILTEWCGFSMVHAPSAYGFDCNKLLNNYLFRGAYNGKSLFALEVLVNGTHKEIKHLHQLQNLIFALTGQELEIKIPAKD